MKKSFMNNIKHFVDSNVRQRIDRAANNNNEFFDGQLLLVERQFEDIRHVCMEAEKRISAMLQSLNSAAPLGAYTQNVQAGLNNLSSLNVMASNASTSSGLTNFGGPPPSPADMIHQSKSSALPPSNELLSTLATMPSAQTGTNSIGNQLLSHGGVNDATEKLRDGISRHKKLPIVGYLKFLVKSCYKLKPDSLLFTTLTHCSQLQTQLTKLYLSYERTIEAQCLKPIQQILEIDAPNVIKLRKLFIKSHNDLESVKAKYNGACQKQQQQQQQIQSSHFTSTSYTIAQSSAHQANINKLDQLKKELDDAVTRFEQARDTYATELYSFVCRETELVNLFMKFYQHQVDYQQQVLQALQSSLPNLSNALATTPRKVVFGTSLEEHLQCTGRPVSLVIELCIHLLYSNALNEEGLFRVPGSSAKIKKLKSAINAWFVTLASQSELENDQQQIHSSACQPSLLAIYDLFKDTVGQTPQQQTTGTVDDTINNQSTIAATTMITSEESIFSQNVNPSSAQDDQMQLVYDVHTISGLLKLYLRELPEPLFTYALYQQWIDAFVKDSNKEKPEALERVIEQLPKTNRDNLRLLIRFLHLLTTHRDSNKMTASNLAITMAPSLIWSQSSNHQQLSGAEQHHHHGDQQDDLQNLNIQMSNAYGVSASLHTHVIEYLIKHAERLFPEQVNFRISELDDVAATLCLEKQQHQQHGLKQGQCLKSTSPTGLSTASSSSFSSASNASVESRTSKGKVKPLHNVPNNQVCDAARDTSRPQQQQQTHSQNPPPIPPAPAIRSNLRQPSDPALPASNRSFQKPAAPPLPPPCNLDSSKNRSSLYMQSDSSGSKSINPLSSNPKAADKMGPVSLRGTGSVPFVSNGASSNHNAMRPTVPPPSRPSKSSTDNSSGINQAGDHCALETHKDKSDQNDNNLPSDNKGSHSLGSSEVLRSGFEELNVVDMDEIDISVPVSPVVSLDSISGEDSSFDNEYPSLDNSWTGGVLERGKLGRSIDEKLPIEQQKPQVADSKPLVKPAPRLQRKPTQEATETTVTKEGCGVPPVKPPRSMSPKITQSTPL